MLGASRVLLSSGQSPEQRTSCYAVFHGARKAVNTLMLNWPEVSPSSQDSMSNMFLFCLKNPHHCCCCSCLATSTSPFLSSSNPEHQQQQVQLRPPILFPNHSRAISLSCLPPHARMEVVRQSVALQQEEL